MKKKFKIAALLLTAVMIAGLLSGCAMTAYELSISSDGSVKMYYGTYFAEDYFTEKGTTPQDYYESEVAKGKKLIRTYDQNTTYWGIEPEPKFYYNIPEFLEAVEDMDGVSAVIGGGESSPYIELHFDMKSRQDVITMYGSREGGEEWVDYALTHVVVSFPGECLTADYPLYGRGERLANNKGYSMYAKYGEKAYSFMLCGRLSPGTALYPIDSIEAEIDEPEYGKTPADINISVSGVRGNLKLDMFKEYEVDIDWYVSGTGSDDQNDWDPISSDTEFEAGKYYAPDIFLYADGSLYAATPDTVVSVNGGENDNRFGETYQSGTVYLSKQFHISTSYNTRPSQPANPSRPPIEGASPSRPSGGQSEQPVILKNASLTVDEPKAGLNVYEIEWRVSDGDLDALDREKAEIEWFRFDDEWVSIDEYERFEAGKLYGFDLKIPVKENVELSADLQLFINGEKQSAGYSVFGELNGSPAALFSWDYSIPEAAGPGSPGGPGGLTTPFTDVTMDDYYFDAVVWAYNAEPQITDGNGKDKFMPDQICTRGQVVTFLYRALKYPLIYSGDNPFKDVNSFDYFYKPVLWAYSNPSQVTDGTTATTFSPGKPCTNAQILTFIWRAMGRPNDKGAEKTPEYWRDAYNWAVSKDLLEGTGISEKNINDPCPRKNVVQLLHLYYVMTSAS